MSSRFMEPQSYEIVIMLAFSYTNDTRVFKNLSFTVPENHFFGESGSKSTIAKLISGTGCDWRNHDW